MKVNCTTAKVTVKTYLCVTVVLLLSYKMPNGVFLAFKWGTYGLHCHV